MHRHHHALGVAARAAWRVGHARVGRALLLVECHHRRARAVHIAAGDLEHTLGEQQVRRGIHLVNHAVDDAGDRIGLHRGQNQRRIGGREYRVDAALFVFVDQSHAIDHVARGNRFLGLAGRLVAGRHQWISAAQFEYVLRQLLVAQRALEAIPEQRRHGLPIRDAFQQPLRAFDTLGTQVDVKCAVRGLTVGEMAAAQYRRGRRLLQRGRVHITQAVGRLIGRPHRIRQQVFDHTERADVQTLRRRDAHFVETLGGERSYPRIQPVRVQVERGLERVGEFTDIAILEERETVVEARDVFDLLRPVQYRRPEVAADKRLDGFVGRGARQIKSEHRIRVTDIELIAKRRGDIHAHIFRGPQAFGLLLGGGADVRAGLNILEEQAARRLLRFFVCGKRQHRR